MKTSADQRAQVRGAHLLTSIWSGSWLSVGVEWWGRRRRRWRGVGVEWPPSPRGWEGGKGWSTPLIAYSMNSKLEARPTAVTQGWGQLRVLANVSNIVSREEGGRNGVRGHWVGLGGGVIGVKGSGGASVGHERLEKFSLL